MFRKLYISALGSCAVLCVSSLVLTACSAGNTATIPIGSNGGGGGLDIGPRDPATCDSNDPDVDKAGCPCVIGATHSCYSGPAGTVGTGSCKAGTQTCVLQGEFNPVFGPCTGEVLPSAADACAATETTGTGGAPAACPGPLTKWVPMSTVGAPPSAIVGPPLVWTGSEVVVFSGRGALNTSIEGGWLYNPKTDSWRTMSTTGAPMSRMGYDAVWTGSRVILWGGRHDNLNGSSGSWLDDGGIYDPATDTWVGIPSLASQGLAGGPTAGQRKVGWTGTELAVYGYTARDGWFYNPATKAWRAFGGGAGILAPDQTRTTSVWTGKSAIVWGGFDSSQVYVNSGARYSDATNTWEPLAASPLSARLGSDFVWTGTHMFIHGGMGPDSAWGLTDGALYDPATDSWTVLPEGGGPRGAGATVWTGCDVLEVGGFSGEASNNTDSTGMRYTPSTKTWSALPALPIRFSGHYDGAVWAGDQLVVYGSGGNQFPSMFAYRLVQ